MKIPAGSKFALVALSSDAANARSLEIAVSSSITVSTKAPVQFDSHWRDWLGSIQSERYENSNAFVVAVMPSQTPSVMDGENITLTKQVTDYYYGLLLAGRLAYYEKPLLLTGGGSGDELSIRQLGEMLTPVMFSGVGHDNIFNVGFYSEAAALTARLPVLWDGTPRYKRLRRIFNIYVGARTTAEISDRLHQYCRCIEGFILPPIGGTKRNFRNRTETFIGPHHHELIGEMYDFRSAVEHLNDHLNLLSRTREDRAQIYRWAHIAEYVARTCLTRVLLSDALLNVFETDETLADFWRPDNSTRQLLWGDIVDPLDGARGFDTRLLSNDDLGLPTA